MKVILKKFSDLRVTSVLLLVLAMETLAGTLLQAKLGLYAAQQMFFHNWFGVPLLGFIAILNLLAVLFVRIRWKWQNTGLIVLHIGLISLLISAGIGWLISEQGYIDLGHGEMSQFASSDTKWEIAYRIKDDSGATIWSRGLEELKIGEDISLGPKFPTLKLIGKVNNGMIGPQNKLIPVSGGNSPESWQPAIALSNGICLSPQSKPWSDQVGHELWIRRQGFALPFALHLKSFHREYHPGTQIASKYESKLVLIEGTNHREVIISMNQPLRIGNYTIFQSSWSTDEQTGMDRSIFSVTKNPLRNEPYFATLLIALGLLLHSLLRWKIKIPRSNLVILLALSVSIPLVHAQQVPTALQIQPILADGRIKPLETYAHHLLLQISGKSSIKTETIGRLDATQWFTHVLLGTDLNEVPIFLVENPEVRDALGLQGKERDRYSWAQMVPLGMKLDSLAHFASMIDAANQSAMQKDVLRIADSWNRYYSILHALDFAVANDTMKPFQNFLEFAQHANTLRPRIDSLLKIHPDSLDVNGRAYLAWVNGVLGSADSWAQAIFPTCLAKPNQWMSPGEILLRDGLENSSASKQIEAWAALRSAWNSKKQPQIDSAAQTLHSLVQEESKAIGISLQALTWEHRYNKLDPYYRAMVLLLLMLIPSFLALRLQKNWLVKLSAFMGLASVGLLAIGMAIRFMITGRPPITNLYETFVFAAACTVFLLLTWGHFRKMNAATFLASLSGGLLLLLARRFGSDGDTMPVLAAVLNSNFWLTVHVITITLGYSGVVAAGAIAHWHLFLLRRQANPESIRSAISLTKEIMAFGLLFTFIGTLLGGIWADQSWGRFWGWDPKENGALLIILWVAFQFHAVPAGWLKDRGFSLASLVALQTVVFAWFGVNLMGVGLHSYGFTQGTLIGIVIFAFLELSFAVWAIRGTSVPRERS